MRWQAFGLASWCLLQPGWSNPGRGPGYETTASALAFTVYCLAANPDKCKALLKARAPARARLPPSARARIHLETRMSSARPLACGPRSAGHRTLRPAAKHGVSGLGAVARAPASRAGGGCGCARGPGGACRTGPHALPGGLLEGPRWPGPRKHVPLCPHARLAQMSLSCILPAVAAATQLATCFGRSCCLC